MCSETQFAIVTLSPHNRPDYQHFNYAVCECTMRNEAIQFPRKGRGTYHQFRCPRCGMSLGVVEGFRGEDFDGY